MRYFIELSYNGKNYHGWQIQPNAITVQEVLQNALSTLLKQQIDVVGAGRTDAGVHAAQLYAHFDLHTSLPENFVFKCNALLPKDIAIHNMFQVKNDVHARFDALSRTYHYRIALSKNVFNFDFAYMLQRPLDVNIMNTACKILLEYNDFQCFSKVNTDVKTYYCNLMKAEWTVVEDELLFEIRADRFLRNMVRAIVGTLVNIGLGKMEVAHLHEIIASKDRSEAGFSVPAHGLYLVEVEYPNTIKL